MKAIKAKKEYKCDLTNKNISIGESYKRINYKSFKNLFYGQRWKKEYLIDYLVEDDYFEETEETLNRMTLKEIYEKYPEDCFDFLCDNQE